MSSPFNRHTSIEYLLSSPLSFCLHPLHNVLNRLQGGPYRRSAQAHPIRVVCISDTHTLEWPNLPGGDLLIHAGDLSQDGSIHEIQAAVDWLKRQPHTYKVVIGGNHDKYLDRGTFESEERNNSAPGDHDRGALEADDCINWDGIHYLHHTSVTLTFPPPSMPVERRDWGTRQLTVFGAPGVPGIEPFGKEHGFVYPPHQDVWSGRVPPETDILVTHTPPQAHLDLSPVYSTGCPYLLEELWRVRPLLHVFGHTHAGYGKETVYWDEAQRAWERLCGVWRRRARYGVFGSLFGPLRDVANVSAWIDAVRIVVYGIRGAFFLGSGRASPQHGTWMVNAACMYRASGQLGNEPQTVIL